MALAYQSKSAAEATAASGNITVTPPTTQDGDLMLLIVASHDNVALTLPDKSWKLLYAANNTAALRLNVYYKYASGDESGQTVTVTHASGAGIIGTIVSFRDTREAAYGSPVSVSSSSANASGTSAANTNALTTVDNDELVVYIVAAAANQTISGQTMNAVAMTERLDAGTADGSGVAISLATKAGGVTPGSTGNFAGTLAGAAVNTAFCLSLRPRTQADSYAQVVFTVKVPVDTTLVAIGSMTNDWTYEAYQLLMRNPPTTYAGAPTTAP